MSRTMPHMGRRVAERTGLRSTYAWLIALYAIETQLDVLSTRLALAAGAIEWNPWVAALLRAPSGWIILITAKLLHVGMISLFVWLAPRIIGQRAAAWICLPLLILDCIGVAILVAHNVALALLLLGQALPI